MGKATGWGGIAAGLLTAVALLSVPTQAAAVDPTSRLVIAGGSATSAKILPGQSVSMDVRIDSPDVATIGVAFRLTQVVPWRQRRTSPSPRAISPARSTPPEGRPTIVPSADPFNGCPNAGDGVLDGTNPLLDPDNNINLGRNVANRVCPLRPASTCSPST